MRTFLRWLLRLIGPALLLAFLLTSDLDALWASVRGAAVWPIVLSLLLMPPFIVIKSYRWLRLLREMGLSLDLGTACALYTVGLFYGTMTPGQAGDLLKAVYLRDRGQPIAPALLSVVVDRLCDLLIMAVLATVGIFALGRLLPSPELRGALIVVFGLGLVVVTTFIVARGPRQWALTVALPRLAPRLRVTLDRWNRELAALHLRPSLIGELALLTVGSACFTFLRLWLLFLALDLTNVPLYVVVGVSALVAVLQVLPISIGGIGVREAVFFPVLAAYGHSTAEAFTLSALFLLINVEHILVGFIVSFWFPLGKARSDLASLADGPERS